MAGPIWSAFMAKNTAPRIRADSLSRLTEKDSRSRELRSKKGTGRMKWTSEISAPAVKNAVNIQRSAGARSSVR